MKQKINLFGSIIIAVIVAASIISAFVSILFKFFLFLYSLPLDYMLIFGSVIAASIAINQTFFKK